MYEAASVRRPVVAGTCPCALIRPGRIVLPFRSTRVAPAGTGVDAGPTAVIFAPETTTVPLSMTLPVPSMTRPPTNAVVCAAAVLAVNIEAVSSASTLVVRMAT